MRSLNERGEETGPFKFKGTRHGGWAQTYIEAKIELYADGKKGGHHDDLLEFAKARGHNLGIIPPPPPALPNTDEAAAEVRLQVAAMARARACEGSSSTD